MEFSPQVAINLTIITDDILYLAMANFAIPRPIAPSFRLNLRILTDEQCLFNFRFTKDQLLQVIGDMGLPEVHVTSERHKFPMIEALCVVCYRMSYPRRLGDVQQLFGRSRTAISLVFNEISQMLVARFKKILNLDEDRIGRNLPRFSGAVVRRGSPLPKVPLFSFAFSFSSHSPLILFDTGLGIY